LAQENKNLNPVNEAAEQTASATSNVLNDDTRIVVEARVPAVYYTCPVTFETFSWLEVGDTQEMTFKQLRIMNTKYPRYFTEKWLLPNDGTVMKKLHLDKIYATKVNRADMKRFCGDDIKDVEELLSGLDSNAKTELTPKIVKYVKDGKIANVKMIRLLEKKLGIELMDLV
jgi:hypothetical protein